MHVLPSSGTFPSVLIAAFLFVRPCSYLQATFQAGSPSFFSPSFSPSKMLQTWNFSFLFSPLPFPFELWVKILRSAPHPLQFLLVPPFAIPRLTLPPSAPTPLRQRDRFFPYRFFFFQRTQPFFSPEYDGFSSTHFPLMAFPPHCCPLQI